MTLTSPNSAANWHKECRNATGMQYGAMWALLMHSLWKQSKVAPFRTCCLEGVNSKTSRKQAWWWWFKVLYHEANKGKEHYENGEMLIWQVFWRIQGTSVSCPCMTTCTSALNAWTAMQHAWYYTQWAVSRDTLELQNFEQEFIVFVSALLKLFFQCQEYGKWYNDTTHTRARLPWLRQYMVTISVVHPIENQ